MGVRAEVSADFNGRATARKRGRWSGGGAEEEEVEGCGAEFGGVELGGG